MKKGLVIFFTLVVALLVNASVYAATFDASGDWDFLFLDGPGIGNHLAVTIAQTGDTFTFSSGPLATLDGYFFDSAPGTINDADYIVERVTAPDVPYLTQIGTLYFDVFVDVAFTLSTLEALAGTLTGTVIDPPIPVDPITSNFTGAKVPIPGAVWLLGSALIGLVGLRRRSMKR